jgi:hypothetical protein
MTEDVGRPCAALAVRALRIEAQRDRDLRAPITFGLVKLMGDAVVSAAVQRRYPSLAPGIVCTALYWRVLADPDYAGSINDLRHVQ